MMVQPTKVVPMRLPQFGIHQDGVIKNRETYEIINPHDVGVTDRL